MVIEHIHLSQHCEGPTHSAEACDGYPFVECALSLGAVCISRRAECPTDQENSRRQQRGNELESIRR